MERRGVRRYALLVARAAERAGPSAAHALPDAAAWWEHWPAHERARFFRALAVHSRLRPDCIAHDVGRSVEEVARVLRTFRRYARRVRRVERQTQSRRSVLRLCPPAHELSPAWLAVEEAGADALAHADDRLGWAHEMDAPAAVAGFLRGSGTEPLAAIVDRLVDDAHSELRPTSAYAAYAHARPLPMLATHEDVASVLEGMLVQGRLVGPPDLPRPLDASSLHTSTPMTWPDTPDDAVLDVDAVAAFLHRHVHGPAVPYIVPATTDALDRSLRSFLTRVLYEVITVGERAMPPASVDAQHVWAAVARLGAVKPDELNTDMAEAVSEQRTWSEPPVAWMQRVPSEARGRKVPLDVALSSEHSSEESEHGEDGEGSAAGSEDAEAENAGGPPTAYEGRERGKSAAAKADGDAGRRGSQSPSASDAGSDAGSHASGRASSEGGAGSEAGSDAGSDASSGAGSDASSNAGSGTGSGAGSGADTDAPPLPPSALVPPAARTPWRIGAYTPLVPHEYAQVDLGDDSSSADDTGSDSAGDAGADSASEPGSDSASDASTSSSSLDRDDQHADAIYEQRLYDWVGLSAAGAQSIPP